MLLLKKFFILLARERTDKQHEANSNAQDDKIDTLAGNRKHVRHSSAPLQRNTRHLAASLQLDTNANIDASTENGNIALGTFSDYDANRTFETFVGDSNSFLKTHNDSTANEILRTTGTQTLETEERKKYFSDRESKRVDANVRRAQKAYYDAYLKQLRSDGREVRPHPPATQPPIIKRPANTLRMNRYAWATGNSKGFFYRGHNIHELTRDIGLFELFCPDCG